MAGESVGCAFEKKENTGTCQLQGSCQARDGENQVGGKRWLVVQRHERPIAYQLRIGGLTAEGASRARLDAYSNWARCDCFLKLGLLAVLFPATDCGVAQVAAGDSSGRIQLALDTGQATAVLGILDKLNAKENASTRSAEARRSFFFHSSSACRKRNALRR